MKIAIVQTTPVKGDIEMNLNAHIQWIKEAVPKVYRDNAIFLNLQ